MCPAKSIKQQKYMGMVHKCQKDGECASPEISKTAKSMKKKDAEDFASTKHKGLPEKVKKKKAKKIKESFVSTSVDSFLNEGFIEALEDNLMKKGLNSEEIDFAIGNLDDFSLEKWIREYDINPSIVKPVSEDILKFMFGNCYQSENILNLNKEKILRELWVLENSMKFGEKII